MAFFKNIEITTHWIDLDFATYPIKTMIKIMDFIIT